MEETKKTDTDIEKVDIDNKTVSDVFEQIYGEDVMKKTEEKQNKMFDKSKKGFVNKGLEVDTNARLSVFANEKVYDNDWTESTLNLLESWRTAAKQSSENHANAARISRKKHRQITIPTLFIGAIGTALSFFSAGEVCDPDDDGSENIKYAVAAFTSAMVVLGGISSLYSFNQKMSENISASGSFANLARRIEVQIFLPNHLRAPSEVVLTDAGAEFSNLTIISPLL